MICRNEEKTIFRCLHHVADFVDEMIIVDTGSTDRTIERARRYTKQIFEFQWTDDFSAARNSSLVRATSDWILLLDADEILYEAELVALGTLMQTDGINRVSLDCHEFEVNYDHLAFDDDISWPSIETRVEPKLRFVRNTGSLRFVGRIHENLDCAHLPGVDVQSHIRFAHYRDRSTTLTKREYYMRLCEEALVSEPMNSNAHFNVLKTCMLRQLQSSFNDAARQISYVEPRFRRHYGDLYQQLEAIGWLEESAIIAALIAKTARER